MAGQRTINSEHRRWQRAIEGLNTGTKPKNASENQVRPQYQLRDINQQDRQEVLSDRPSEGPEPPPKVEQKLPGVGAFKCRSHQEQEQTASIRVKIRGESLPPKERQGAAAGRFPEVPDHAPDSDQKPRGAGAFQSKIVQRQDPPVPVRRITPIQPEGTQEANKEN